MSDHLTSNEGFYQKPAHGWTCFHCGETFTTVGAARDHFGGNIDSEPGCMIRVQVGEERGLLMALRRSEAEAERLRALIEAESRAAEVFYPMLETAIQSFKPFRQCRSLHDVFNVYDSMEGRALAAEEQLRENPA